MDKTLYNASGCKDKTAHDAICAANKTQVFRFGLDAKRCGRGYVCKDG